ncbi:MAG: hypothetical protein WC134_01460 [Acholeplasmataceae bacterium]|nr:hypothetical protein [Acholeplasmataceae bacterium]
MRNKKILFSVLLILGMFVILNGCTKEEPIISKFENLQTTATVDDEYYPINPMSVFDPSTPYIYLTGNMKDAEIGSEVIAEWYYISGEEDLYLYQMKLEVTEADLGFYFSLSKPTDNWYIGDYVIYLFYNDEWMETVEFSVE